LLDAEDEGDVAVCDVTVPLPPPLPPPLLLELTLPLCMRILSSVPGASSTSGINRGDVGDVLLSRRAWRRFDGIANGAGGDGGGLACGRSSSGVTGACCRTMMGG